MDRVEGFLGHECREVGRGGRGDSGEVTEEHVSDSAHESYLTSFRREAN